MQLCPLFIHAKTRLSSLYNGLQHQSQVKLAIICNEKKVNSIVGSVFSFLCFFSKRSYNTRTLLQRQLFLKVFSKWAVMLDCCHRAAKRLILHRVVEERLYLPEQSFPELVLYKLSSTLQYWYLMVIRFAPISRQQVVASAE